MLPGYRVIDLTVTISRKLPAVWPTHMPFDAKMWNYYVPLVERQGYVPSEAPYQTRYSILGDHVGTHFDAPTHFIPPPDSGLPHANEWGLQTADKVPLDDLIGSGVVIDLTSLAKHGTLGQSPWITIEHINEWETKNGKIKPGSIVLFYTGWDKYYVEGVEGLAYTSNPLKKSVIGWPAPHFSTIRYLCQRGIKCLGTDAPSIGAVQDMTSGHVEGLGRGMRYIEELTGLEKLPPRGFIFMFLPVKIEDSSGGTGRAIALLPERN